jgi:hypothetical protein
MTQGFVESSKVRVNGMGVFNAAISDKESCREEIRILIG